MKEKDNRRRSFPGSFYFWFPKKTWHQVKYTVEYELFCSKCIKCGFGTITFPLEWFLNMVLLRNVCKALFCNIYNSFLITKGESKKNDIRVDQRTPQSISSLTFREPYREFTVPSSPCSRAWNKMTCHSSNMLCIILCNQWVPRT